jgi:hypothetical protein
MVFALTGRSGAAGAVLAVLAVLNAGPALAQAAAGTEPVPPSRDAMGFAQLLEELRAAEAALAVEPSSRELALRRLGALYLVGVQEKWATRTGLAALDSLPPAPAPGDEALPEAYRGAFTVLLGKHAFWPHDKLKHVRNGLAALDRVVERSPDSARIRYLRLMSGYYLPGLFGRGDEVRADFAALARLLPGAAPEFPPRLHREIVRFVLENGGLAEPDRERLERSTGGS